MGLNVDKVVLALMGLQCSLLIFLLCYILGKMDASHSPEHHMGTNKPRAELRKDMP